MTTVPDPSLRFAGFEIRRAERAVWIDGQAIAIGARAYDVLVALAERRDRLVTRQELLDLVWPGVAIEEHNITTQISTLRKLLGAGVIATVPGRGYRFTAAPAGPDATAPDPPPGRSASPPPARGSLPRELTPLIGREDDLEALAALIGRTRLVTVLGAGGAGKSLLAKHVVRGAAASFADGVCWVELASTSDPAAVPARIAESLGVHGRADSLDALCAAATPLALLLAIDNAEHLVAAVASVATALLEAAPGLRLLVTSQAPLRVGTEQVYRLGPLAVPERSVPANQARSFGAISLFVERARGADARFSLSDATAPAAIELCRQLDGLPLAIELAAARASLLGVARLTASTHDLLRLLTHNRDAAAPARQQTLRAALAWSHDLLDERERIVFRRLGVMADAVSLTFLQQVVADDTGGLDAWAVLDALGILVDRSLVTVVDNDDAGDPRYRLLEAPRLFAMEQLLAAGELDALRRRHALALAAAFDGAWDELWSGRVPVGAWVGRMMLDANDAREALAWARASQLPDTAVTIAATLYTALPRALHGERMALGDLCESVADAVASPQLQLRALIVGARPLVHPQQQRSLAVAERAVAIARELDREAPDRWSLYRALGTWIEAAALVSEPPREALRAALAELATLEDPGWPPHRKTRGIGAERFARAALGGPGQPAEQLRLTRQMFASLEAEGSDTAPLWGTLIDAELECGNVAVAIELAEDSLARLAGTRDEWSRTMVRANLVLAYLERDDTARARPTIEAIWPPALRWNVHTLCSDSPGLLAALEGRVRTAARLTGYADAAYAARGLLRHPLEVRARERCRTLARTALGDATFAALEAEGRRLRDDQVPALAFGTVDSD